MSNTPPLPEGVSADAWSAIGAQAEGNTWTLPERDSAGEIVGTSIRLADGSKTFKPGGHRGLTMFWPLKPYDGSKPDDPIIVVEGATDAAAGIGLGLDVVGRPSCTGGVPILSVLLKDRHVCIIAENDQKPEKDGKPGHWPGRDGADNLAAALVGVCASVKIIFPPKKYKDLRSWIVGGANRADVELAIKAAEPVKAAGVKVRRTPSPRYKPFPLKVLPRSMKDYIRETAEGMDADPVMIAAPALAMFAGAIGNTVRLVVRHKWSEPSCLWTGVVCLPSSMKSQTQEAAAAPAHNAQRTADAAHEKAVESYKAAKVAHDAAKSPKSKPKAGGTSTPPMPEPEEPKRWQCITQDATPESLVGVLAHNPRGVVNLWDELGGFFGGFGRYQKGGANAGESGAAFFKSAYTGAPHTENRKGADGKGRYVRIERPLVSVAGGIQPEALKRILQRQYIEDGLASRFLWVMPPDNPPGWVDDDNTSDAAGIVYSETYRRLLGIPMVTDPITHELTPAFVGLKIEAKAVAKEWVNGVREHVRNAPDPAIRAMWGKLKGGAFRIALVLHMTEWAERGGAGDYGAITADTMRRAVPIAEWFGHEGERVYGMLGESDADRETRQVTEWIAKRPGGAVSPNELAKGMPSRFADSDAAGKWIIEQVKAGLIVKDEQPDNPVGGRPTVRYRPSPIPETLLKPVDSEGLGYGDDPATPEDEGGADSGEEVVI